MWLSIGGHKTRPQGAKGNHEPRPQHSSTRSGIPRQCETGDTHRQEYHRNTVPEQLATVRLRREQPTPADTHIHTHREAAGDDLPRSCHKCFCSCNLVDVSNSHMESQRAGAAVSGCSSGRQGEGPGASILVLCVLRRSLLRPRWVPCCRISR